MQGAEVSTCAPILSTRARRLTPPSRRFILRDFTYDEKAINQQQKDLVNLEKEESELWTDLLRLSRINFSELFQILVHIKVLRAYIESVLRYGLPAAYFGAVIKVSLQRPSEPGFASTWPIL